VTLAPQYVRTTVIYTEINGKSPAGFPQRGQPPGMQQWVNFLSLDRTWLIKLMNGH